jgi:predicted PurR-regulated permease PerM
MIDFTPSQKKTVASGFTVLSLAVVFSFVAGLLWATFKFLAFASAAIIPVVLGYFLSIFFKPYYNWWKSLVRNPMLAAFIMLSSVLVPVGLLLWYAGAVIIGEILDLLAQGPELVKQVTSWFKESFPMLHAFLIKIGFDDGSFGELYSHYGATAVKASAGALKCLKGILTVLVTLIFFVFFLMSKDRRGSDIVKHLPFFTDNTKNFVAEQIDSFIAILIGFFRRQTVICLIEGAMYGTGFWAVGLPYGFLIGFALGVMNLIPFFGSVMCLPIALPLAYFTHDGSAFKMLAVLVVWGCGQFLDGYFITPKIQGDKTGIGYAGVIFSFFFWATVLGPMLGMLLAIPLSAFCVVLWRSVTSRYIKPVI